MAFFSVLIFFNASILIFFSYLKTKTLINPVTIFVSWWSFWLIISTFGFFNLYVPSLRTYLLVIINLIMFSLGFLITAKGNKRNKSLWVNWKKINWYHLSQIFLFLIVALLFIRAIPLFLELPYSEIRQFFFEQREGGILLTARFYHFFRDILYPIIIINLLLSTILMIYKKEKKNFFFLSVLTILMYSIMSGGRWGVFYFLVFSFLSFIFKENRLGFFRFMQRLKLKNFLFPLLIVVFITFIRGPEGFKGFPLIFRVLTVYFTGPFIALDRFISDVPFGFQHGFGTLGGLESIFAIPLRRVGVPIETSASLLKDYVSDSIFIGSEIRFNAFYTMIYNFYADGGLIGVFIIPLILGIIIGCLFYKFNKSPNIFNLAMLIFLLTSLIVGSIRWDFLDMRAWISLFALLFLKFTTRRGRL